jgi:hypothetical protein
MILRANFSKHSFFNSLLGYHMAGFQPAKAKGATPLPASRPFDFAENHFAASRLAISASSDALPAP